MPLGYYALQRFLGRHQCRWNQQASEDVPFCQLASARSRHLPMADRRRYLRF
ncbi:hypothetical protein IEO21_04225 [Rhodonia placenta]|uniref:Uncharacterized protein n=1 Tax=Rhodonia placenta TaxID=104341 RepID=A0A8H7P485_9APHY|nr:hypothetical protein IEO21_04225 [Postia placenta]